MNRNFHHITASLLVSTIMLFTPQAGAAETVSEQPISIYADRLSINDTTGVSLYRGNVELQQGDLKFSGDELELTQVDGTVTLMRAIGKPAHFERSEPEPLKAEATRIDYDNNKGEVILRGNAQLWQNGDTFTSELIHYYTESRRVKAQGGSGGDQQSGRVHVLIQPKDKEDKK